MSKPIEEIKAIFNKAGLKGKDLKDALRETVRELWPDLPKWSTLDGAIIEEVQKASVGSGVVLTFEENGVHKAVLAQAGLHYKPRGHNGPMLPSYMILGGFINLTSTEGSSRVPASKDPEDPRIGAAREIEEEFKKPDGSPLLSVDPSRLKPMDTKTLTFRNGERHLVTPGITGWSQVHGKRVLGVNDVPEKLHGDLFYVENWSLFMDLAVCCKTAAEVLFHKAA